MMLFLEHEYDMGDDDGRSLHELIELAGFDMVNPLILRQTPAEEEQEAVGPVMKCQLQRTVMTPDLIEEITHRALRGSTIRNLLRFRIRYPRSRSIPIAALGSSYRDDNGKVAHPYAYGLNLFLSIELKWFAFDCVLVHRA